MLELLENKKVLVVVAHPDDELLGVGATINRLVSHHNVKARAVILGEGITSRSEKRDAKQWEDELAKHKSDIAKAAECIGFESFGTYDFPDNRFDHVDLLDIVKVVEAEKERYMPDVIFTHHGSDTNIDHQRTFEAVITATRPMKEENVCTILTFETPSSTEWQAFNHKSYFTPNFYVGLDEEHIKSKIRGMEMYQFEKREFPHPRSPEALRILAQKRGVEVGMSYAEAFMLIRNIIKI